MISAPDLEANIDEIVINRRLALSSWLTDSLDKAAKEGQTLPRYDEIAHHTVHYDDPKYLPTPHFTGVIKEGICSFAEEMRWVTLRESYGWGIPTAECVAAIATLAGDRPIIDFGAGTGYWTAVLRKQGLTVYAADTGSWKFKGRWIDHLDYDDGFKAMEDHPNALVLISWPDPSLTATRLVNLLAVGGILMRCGSYKVTGTSFGKLCLTAFDEIENHPVCSATMSEDSTTFEILRKRAIPKPMTAKMEAIISNPFESMAGFSKKSREPNLPASAPTFEGTSS